MDASPYRHAGPPRAVDQLAARGASRRAATGVDPHAPQAPTQVSGVRSTLGDRLAAIYGEIFLTKLGVNLTIWLLSVIGGVLMLFVYGVARTTGNPLHAPLLLAVLFVLIGSVAARRRNAPRRWLAGRPFRVDGYLELQGREKQVSRVLARVEFAGPAPDPTFVGDVLTGADCETHGVVPLGPHTLGLHSPAFDGNARALHAWFQGVVDRALVPLDEAASIRSIEVQER